MPRWRLAGFEPLSFSTRQPKRSRGPAPPAGERADPHNLQASLFAPRADEFASTAAQCGFCAVLRAIGRAWGWRRRMEAGEFGTIQELAEAVGLAG